MNYITVLETVYLECTKDKPTKDCRMDIREQFTAFYDLNIPQMKALAHMAHFHPIQIEEGVLLRKLNRYDQKSAKEYLDELIQRGFITQGPAEPPIVAYNITQDAYFALYDGTFFGPKLSMDCYKHIEESENIMSKNWRTHLYNSAKICEDKQMYNAINTLEVQSWSEEEQNAFWILVKHFMTYFTSPFAFKGNNSELDLSPSGQIDVKRAMGHLVKKGIVNTIPIEPLEDSKETERFVLSVKVVKAMFQGHDEYVRYEEMAKVANVILAKDIEQKELFFSEKIQKEVNHLLKILSKDGFERAKQILMKQKRNPSIQSLFWGAPGTGKTEVIKQIARETGRDLFLFDAAKTTASAWGATEKNYRALFLGYSYLVAICDKTPILFINEADQILSHRLTDISSSLSKSENTVSNIILQSLEDMEGILLATTNLITNLDVAFDRRLLFKTELTKPDAAARCKIWKASLPELSDTEAEELGRSFEMTGAQISNVIAKRGLAELYEEGDLGMSYIIKLCKTEMQEPVKGSSSRRVGF